MLACGRPTERPSASCVFLHRSAGHRLLAVAFGRPRRSAAARSGGGRDSAQGRPPPEGRAVSPGGQGPVPGGDRPAQLHRPEQPLRRAWAPATAIGASGWPRPISSCCCPTATARAGSAASAALRQRVDPGRARARGRRRRRPRLAATAALGRARPRFAASAGRTARSPRSGRCVRPWPPARDADFRSAVALYPGLPRGSAPSPGARGCRR